MAAVALNQESLELGVWSRIYIRVFERGDDHHRANSAEVPGEGKTHCIVQEDQPAASGIPQKRIRIDDDGRLVPLVPREPLLSSALQEWEGFLLERHLTGGFEVPQHNHSSILLSMQLNAKLHLGWHSSSGNRNALIEAGSLTLHGHSGCSSSIWDGDYNRVVFELDPRHLERLTEGRFAGARVEVAEKWTFRDPRLEHLLKVLHSELQLGAPSGHLFAEQVGNAVAMILARHYAHVPPGEYGTGGKIPPARLKRVFDYVEDRLEKKVHVSHLAEVASMSPYYFARLFKRSTGMTPHEYIESRRIERAKELLRSTDLSVFEIGIRVGHLDPKQFRSVFRRRMGVTPAEFRAANS